MASVTEKDPNVAFDMSPFCKIMKDNSIQRLIGEDLTPASVDPRTGVISKDVVISDDVSARIYLPKNHSKDTKLPIVVYFHGGGFIIGHAASTVIHAWVNTFVAASNVIAVSVEYRLAPEHLLPAAYDDAWTAVHWVSTSATETGKSTESPAEPWLAEYGDFSNLYLAGESAGANIAHNTAMRAASSELANGVKIKGIALVQPYFWGSEKTESELAEPHMFEFINPLWEFICPNSVKGRDDPRVNPMAAVEEFAKLGCERVFVSIGGKDTLRDRARKYCEVLKKSGWKGEVEVFELEDGSHDYHIFEPEGENTKKLGEGLGRFFGGHRS